MRIFLLILFFLSFLNAIEFKDIDRQITFNMWDKSTSPTNYDVTYLKDIIKNINKLENTNLQFEEVLKNKHLQYKSYDAVEVEYNQIVNRLKISKFFYNFEKAQIILVLLIAQKSSVYGNDYSYDEQKESIIKYLHSYINKYRSSDAKMVQFQNFRNGLRAYRVTNFMLKKAFDILPKLIK